MSALAAPVPGAAAERSRFPARVEAAGATLVVAAAVALWALTSTYPNYDAYYHLVWGRELLDGLAPSFEAYAAPTQHPLYLALAAALGLVGESADRLLVLVCLLSHAALVIGTYRLGAATFGRWPGLVAALFVGASASFLLYAARGYVDSPFLALVVWAGVLEAQERGPRRPALALGLAGLLRPEAWVLTGLYWLWIMRGARGTGWRGRPGRVVPSLPRGGAAAVTLALVAPPLAWSLVDLVVTGDPLHSLHATSELADELGREQGLGAVPGSFAAFIGATVRPPVAALALVGAAVALRRLGRRATRVPLALFAAGVATFVGTGALGLSILPRYLTVPAVALCLFAGYALAGFTTLARADPLRRMWTRLSIGATLLGLVALMLLAPSLHRVATELTFLRESHEDLVALLDDPAVTRARACGPLTFPNYRLVPDARWHLDAPRGAVGARSALRRERGAAVFALTPKGLRRFGFADGASPTTNAPDPGFAPVARHGYFAAYAACPG